MANPKLIREALMALMGAKKQNNKQVDVMNTHERNGTSNLLAEENEAISNQGLENARRQAQQVQGQDPLTQRRQYDNAIVGGNSQTGPIEGMVPRPKEFPQHPQRLRELDNAPSRANDPTGEAAAARYAEDSGGMEQELIRKFEELTGGPPDPSFSMTDIQKVVDVLDRGNVSNQVPDLMDEIPF